MTAMSLWVHSPLSFLLSRPAAAAPHRAQWSRSGVQGELQETGRGGGLEGAHGEETLVCGEEHSHLCAVRDQDPSQEPPGLGP